MDNVPIFKKQQSDFGGDVQAQDGRIIVEISQDAMIARASFFPPMGDGHALTLEEAVYEIRGSGVSEGIDEAMVAASLSSSNSETKILRDIIIARGKHPRPSIPETLIFHPKIQALDPIFLPPEKQAAGAAGATSPSAAAATSATGAGAASGSGPAAGVQASGAALNIRPDDHGNIDFRDVQGLFIIKEGQILAARRQAIEGIPGTSVRGMYLPFAPLSASVPKLGTNVTEEDGKVRSTKNGRFAWNSSSFWVEETLVLAQDVGYKTGNIRFPGSIVLKAGIKDRFKIWVGGNFEAAGVVDAYEVFCGGDLSAKGGIIGRGKALVRVRGSIETRFIEHCDVEALGNISFELGILNSHVYTMGTISSGDKGRIQGGRTQARGGMSVFQIGNGAGVHTEISVGENYVMHRKLDYARDKFQTISLALRRIEERLKKSEDTSLMHQKERLSEEANRYQTMMVEILGEINDDESATLTVHGSVHPGTVIEICRVPYTVIKEIKASVFRLDKQSGKVLAESIAKPAK